MGIALVIVGGLVLITAVASGFDYLGKRRKRISAEVDRKVVQLEERLATLEGKVAERDERIAQLESDLSFTNRLIEDKSGK
jgi:uncharacterized coiled-coil protein SlyX